MYVLLFFHDKLHFYATYSICQVMCLDLRCASLKHKCRTMFWVLRCDYFIIFFSLSLCSWCLIYQTTFWVWVACLLKYFPCFDKCLSCLFAEILPLFWQMFVLPSPRWKVYIRQRFLITLETPEWGISK